MKRGHDATMQIERELPRRKRTRSPYFDYATPNCVVFTASCTANGLRLFVNRELAEAAIRVVREERERLGHAVYVFCFMPDHLHLLVSPQESGVPVTRLMGSVHSRITRLAMERGHSGKVFQRGFYDHVLRTRESVFRIGQYILHNPVRRGLVHRYEDYPYCGMIDPAPM
jgi:putative transposase